jgi:hypothetical protein
MLNLNNTEFKTKSEIRQLASSIFTTQGAPTTSEKYAHISTEKIIDDMELLGWGVVDAKQVRARKSDTIGYQKHLVVFRNNDIQITAEDGDDVFPQILLTNSHDGKNAFTFTAGLFRMVCENGLVISSREFEHMKIRHYGYSFEELQDTIKSIVEKLPLTVESLNKFRQVELSQEQALDFAKKAIATRFNEDEIDNIQIDLQDLLTPTRREDRGNDLWSVYNVVQEKLIHGMFNYKYGTKTRKARKIKNFKQDLVVNERLYDLALEFIPVAA